MVSLICRYRKWGERWWSRLWDHLKETDQTGKSKLKMIINMVCSWWGNILIFQQVARNRKRDTEASEMNTKVTLAVESINEMKRTVENVVFEEH